MFFIEMAKKFFPGGSDGKESACNAGEPGSIHMTDRAARKAKLGGEIICYVA